MRNMDRFTFPVSGPLRPQDIPAVRPRTVVRFSREKRSYQVHYSEYAPRTVHRAWRKIKRIRGERRWKDAKSFWKRYDKRFDVSFWCLPQFVSHQESVVKSQERIP